LSKYTLFLGDNPFFGVNHLSQEIARNKSAKSQNFENTMNVMEQSLAIGVNKMVVSTHPELKKLLHFLEKNSTLLEKFEFYPIIPYAQGYVSKTNEMAMINTLKETLNNITFKNKIKILSRGGLAYLQKDFFKLFQTLVDIELLALSNVNIKCVFLHDVMSDLAMSLNMQKLFSTFVSHVNERYHTKVGLVTKNFPTMVSKLNEWDIDVDYIMTSFNPIGFQMNPNRKEYEKSLDLFPNQVIAMSILGGGFINTQNAIEYLSNFSKIKNLVVGTSSVNHAKETFEMLSSL